METRQFVFLGFLPRQRGNRRTLIKSIASETRTLVCFEAPSRLRQSLADLLDCLGDRRIALCRELTKLHEETLRMLISEATERPDNPRGEYTLVIQGAAEADRPEPGVDFQAELAMLRDNGTSAREATSHLTAKYKFSRRAAPRRLRRVVGPKGGQGGNTRARVKILGGYARNNPYWGRLALRKRPPARWPHRRRLSAGRHLRPLPSPSRRSCPHGVR